MVNQLRAAFHPKQKRCLHLTWREEGNSYNRTSYQWREELGNIPNMGILRDAPHDRGTCTLFLKGLAGSKIVGI